MKIQNWARAIVKEIFNKYKKNYSPWKPGLKIFYSPIFLRPKLVIISYQPGGNKTHYAAEDKKSFKAGDFSLPKGNAYAETNSPMSIKVRDLFSFTGGMNLLKKSVVFPIIFFRASSVTMWRKKIPRKIRLEMEEFSISKVDQILSRLKPKKILIIGMETYNLFKKKFGNLKNEKILHTRSANRSRMAVSAIVGGYSVFVIIHPTGSRISKSDWNIIKSLFKEWIT